MGYINNINLFNNKIFKSKSIIFVIIFCFLVFPDDIFAKDINVTGSFGLYKCTEIVHASGTQPSQYVDCSYQGSNAVVGSTTSYIFLDKAVRDFSGEIYNYNSVTRLFLFADYSFKKDSYYTINYSFNNGSYIDNYLPLTNNSNFGYSYFYNNDYVANQGLTDYTYSVNYDYTDYSGVISITFKCTENTNSYRFTVDYSPVFRNTSFDFANGYRAYLINAIETEDNTSALLGQITNQNNTIINQNQQQINEQQQTNDKLDDILNDEPLSEDVIDDFFEGIGANFTTDTPISDLLLMPFTLLEAYSNGLSGSCSSFDLGNLLGTDLVMPCIDLESILGSSFWNLLDMLFSLFMFYEIAMLIISIFDSVTSLEDTFQLLYSPRHGDMSRTGRGHSRGLY